MEKIKWCKCQKKGIRLIEPNNNLAEEYLKNAEESMKVLKAVYPTQSNMWLATTKYYVEYFSIYALLMKIGIKCEIHDCTLALVNLLEIEGILGGGTYQLLEDDKGLRTDNQYYLKNKKVEVDFNKISNFLLKMREILNSLTKEKIDKIRGKIENE